MVLGPADGEAAHEVAVPPDADQREQQRHQQHRVEHLGGHEDRHQRDVRNQDGERADERDDPERQIEGPGLGVRIVNSRFDARVLAYRVGSRERQYGGGQKRGPDQADGEQCRRRGAGQRLECHCGVSGVADGTAVAVQRRRTRHHDEEADDARKHGARDHVDPLEREVLGSKLLVDRVGLDEREPTGRAWCRRWQ